jgi:hypothetical protein
LPQNPSAGRYYDDAKVCFGFYVPYIFFGNNLMYLINSP